MINFADSIDIENFKSLEIPLLIEFWSYDCLACNHATQFLMQIEEAYKNKLKIIKVDIQRVPEVVIKYKIKILPTFLIFKNNEIVLRTEGFGNKFQFEKSIRNCL